MSGWVNTGSGARWTRDAGGRLSVAAVVVAVLAGGVASPAHAGAIILADEEYAVPVQPWTASHEDLTFVPLRRDNAEKFEFEIRVDRDGDEYGVPIGDAPGEMAHATRKLRPDTLVGFSERTAGRAGEMVIAPPDGTVCGTAHLELQTENTFDTNYRIDMDSSLPIKHVIEVDSVLSDSTGAVTYSGRNEFSRSGVQRHPSWGHFGRIIKKASTRLGWTTSRANVSVVTTRGVCTASHVTAMWTPETTQPKWREGIE